MSFLDNLCVVKSKDRKGAIDEIIFNCRTFKNLSNLNKFEKAVLIREKLGSTEIGHSVVVTHGKMEGVHNAHASLGISKEGIKWPSGNIIHFIFVFASNPLRYDLYVKKISAILCLFHYPELREELLSLKDDFFAMNYEEIMAKKDKYDSNLIQLIKYLNEY